MRSFQFRSFVVVFGCFVEATTKEAKCGQAKGRGGHFECLPCPGHLYFVYYDVRRGGVLSETFLGGSGGLAETVKLSRGERN